MSEYIINTYKSKSRPTAEPEQKTRQSLDWKQQKELWKQIIDHYHKGTRRISSPC